MYQAIYQIHWKQILMLSVDGWNCRQKLFQSKHFDGMWKLLGTSGVSLYMHV